MGAVVVGGVEAVGEQGAPAPGEHEHGRVRQRGGASPRIKSPLLYQIELRAWVKHSKLYCVLHPQTEEVHGMPPRTR